MGNLPSSTSTEPLAQGKHRNLSTISLPPTIPRRHNLKDAERREIFPISDEGAPPLPNRRGSIGFFRGRRGRSTIELDHDQLFHNLHSLQELQNMDMTLSLCSWQQCQYLSDSSNANSNLNSLSTTPTTTTTTPALTVAGTPTTPSRTRAPPPPLLPLQASSSWTSPVALSIQGYSPRQEEKLAAFMRRQLLAPHEDGPLSSPNPAPDCCCGGSCTSGTCPDTSEHPLSTQRYDQLQHQQHAPQSPFQPLAELHANTDNVPATHDVPCLSVSEWGNQGRWAGEQEWSDDIPEGLEHDSGPWDVMDSYTVEQHIARALFKGQNYSAPLDFSKKANGGTQRGSVSSTSSGESGNSMSDTEANLSDGQGSCSSLENAKPKPILRSRNKGLDPEQGAPTTNTKAKAAAAAAMAAEMKEDADSSMFGAYSFSSMATLGPHSPIPSKENERSLVILSVGCGNTQWATEMALAHPRSAVHAINVSQNPSLPPVPESAPNFDLENLFFYNLDDNSLRIPFASNSVDYIHVRRFLPNVSKSKYLAFMRELVRVLKVGGYIELVELDQRLRGSGVDSCWPSYWTLIGFDKMGIDTSLALNLAGILRSLSGVEVTHRSSVSMPVGIHGGRLGLAAELLCWRSALTIRPWLMRQAMLSGSEFDDLLERARQETRTLKSYQVCHVAVARKTASGTSLAF